MAERFSDLECSDALSMLVFFCLSVSFLINLFLLSLYGPEFLAFSTRSRFLWLCEFLSVGKIFYVYLKSFLSILLRMGTLSRKVWVFLMPEMVGKAEMVWLFFLISYNVRLFLSKISLNLSSSRARSDVFTDTSYLVEYKSRFLLVLLLVYLTYA